MNLETTRSQTAKSSFSMDDFAKALDQENYQFEKGQIVRGKVFEYSTDGAYVDIGGKSAAFLPVNEISLKRISSSDLAEVLPLHEERDFLIVRDQNEEGQVTVSLKQLAVRQAWNKMTEIQEGGQSVQARVTGINKGGVTVDVGGLRGFIPRSHLVERDNLESLLGQNLTTNFLEVNRETSKLVLSQRQATRSAAISQLVVGQLVEGKITGIKPFGVFIDLDGTTGLLHIKQVSQNFISSLDSLFHLGQVIKALIIDVDEGKGRISLSTRVLENHPGEVVENLAEVLSSAEARSERARKKLLNTEG